MLALTLAIIVINYLLIIYQLKPFELARIVPETSVSYNVAARLLNIINNWTDNFKNICTILKTTTSVEVLTVNMWLDATFLDSLGEALTQNQSIKTLRLLLDRPIDFEAFTRFSTTIRTNKKLKNIEFRLEPDIGYLPVLGSIKGIYMPTRGVELCVTNSWDAAESLEFYQTQIEVLKTTNINKIHWNRDFLFGGTSYFNLPGFKVFCEYLVNHDPLKELVMCLQMEEKSLLYLANVLRASKKLRRIEIEFTSYAPPNLEDLLDALTKSSLHHLTIIGLASENQEKLFKIAETIRAMEKLTFVSFVSDSIADELQMVEILRGSESLRSLKLILKALVQEKECEEISLRNIRLQNTRVADLLTVLFNIARDTSSPSSSSAHIHSIPRDVWPSIASFVSIPGVNLDFGDIARSIFKDRSVRRVINKPVIMGPKRKSY